jgi:hypothetical protein
MIEVDERVDRPELAAQFLSTNDFPWSFKQRDQHLKRLFLQSYPLSPLAQFPCLEIHFERTESDNSRQRIAGHGKLPFAAV